MHKVIDIDNDFVFHMTSSNYEDRCVVSRSYHDAIEIYKTKFPDAEDVRQKNHDGPGVLLDLDEYSFLFKIDEDDPQTQD